MIKGGPGCSIQCIKSGVAYARGVNAELVVHTDTAARISFNIWDDDGYSKVVSSDAGQFSFSYHFDDLEPGTTYQAMAIAEDGEGYASHALGSFTTLKRNVTVRFTHADILHAPGVGSYFFDLWVDDDWVDGIGIDDDPLAAPPFAADGDAVWFAIITDTFEDVDRHLDLAVQLWERGPENDCEVFVFPIPSPVISESAGGCWTLAYAALAAGDDDLDERPADAPSWTEHTLHRTLVPPGDGYPLRFTVDVRLDVTYD